jgi:ERI1 exoribonuclease 3
MVEALDKKEYIYEELIAIFIENKSLAKANKIDLQVFLNHAGLKSKGIDKEKLSTYVNSNAAKLMIEQDNDGNQKTQEKSYLVFLDEESIKKTSPFDYLLILDFEAQCSETEKLKCQEIIEFPTLLLNTKTLEVEEEYFHTYVKPEIYPVLFPFCTELTGIKQSQVDAGLKLVDAIKSLEEFLKKKGVFEKTYSFVTCGFWDLNSCLKNEAKYKHLEVPQFLRSYINVKQVFSEGFLKENKDLKSLGMPKMLELLKLNLDGRHHSGIDDCRNIAKICIELLKKGISFRRSFKNYVKY